MLIQVILILSIIFISVYFMRFRDTSKAKAYKKLTLIAFVIAAIIVILFPELLTWIANLIGVGRGTDLLLYGLTLVIIFQMFNSYNKDKQEERRFVKLVRRVAINEARFDSKK